MSNANIITYFDSTSVIQITPKINDRITPHGKLPDMKELAPSMNTTIFSYVKPKTFQIITSYGIWDNCVSNIKKCHK